MSNLFSVWLTITVVAVWKLNTYHCSTFTRQKSVTKIFQRQPCGILLSRSNLRFIIGRCWAVSLLWWLTKWIFAIGFFKPNLFTNNVSVAAAGAIARTGRFFRLLLFTFLLLLLGFFWLFFFSLFLVPLLFAFLLFFCIVFGWSKRIMQLIVIYMGFAVDLFWVCVLTLLAWLVIYPRQCSFPQYRSPPASHAVYP